jgi:hypothetical protein
VPKENFCKDVIVWAPKNAWMTLELMKDWLGCVRVQQPGALSKPHCMLAMSAFYGRSSDKLRNRLRSRNTDLVIISSGMTSQLQPLDGSVNKPFMYLDLKHCDAWLNKDNQILTPSGKTKRASMLIIVEWIRKALKEVPVNIIPKPFSKCCLSNAEDETQDYIVWDDSEQSGKVHHHQKMKVRLKDHWMNFLIK